MTASKTSLGHEWVCLGKWARRSRIFYEKARNGVFVCRSSGVRDLVRPYYGSLAYEDLGKEL